LRQALHPPAAKITVTGVLSALGDPIRLQIVRILADGAEHLRPDFVVPVGQSTLSHHMKMLREAGVAVSRPEGTRCFVSLRPELEQRFPGLLQAILAAADGAGADGAGADGAGAGLVATGSGEPPP
jgi:DNA-binding transcriptional ArsR family regulator